MLRDADGIDIGRRIRAARRRRQFSRRSLAEFCGVSADVVSRWETGEGLPANRMRTRIADGLGVSASALEAGGETWDAELCRLTALLSPHLFDIPAQYPVALGSDLYRPREAGEKMVPVAPTASRAIAVEETPRCRFCGVPSWAGICVRCWRGRG